MNRDKAIQSYISNPSLKFKSVKSLLASKVLNKQEKLLALQNWKQTCKQVNASTNEGMSINESADDCVGIESEITDALRKLNNK